jgi:hypothetical protein
LARIKGVALVEMVKFLRRQRAQARELLLPDLHHYLDERILVGSWYPEADVQAILKVYLELLGDKDGYEQAGILLARQNLSTIYASVIGHGESVESVLTYISGLWSNYHNSGRETATFSGGVCRIEISGFTVRSAEYCRLVGAYNGELIRVAGGTVEKTRKLACTASGGPTCVWEYDWSPDPRRPR